MEQKTSFELLIENEDMEESHYVHTIRDVLDLIDTYGWEPVLKDIIRLKENQSW